VRVSSELEEGRKGKIGSTVQVASAKRKRQEQQRIRFRTRDQRKEEGASRRSSEIRNSAKRFLYIDMCGRRRDQRKEEGVSRKSSDIRNSAKTFLNIDMCGRRIATTYCHYLVIIQKETLHT
jgi:hypothetical protein